MGKRKLPWLSSEELNREVQMAEVSPTSPLEVFVRRTMLLKIITDSLEAIEANRETSDTTEERRLETDRLVTQRRQFLADLRANDTEWLFMAMYPAELYERRMVDADEDEGERELPFDA